MSAAGMIGRVALAATALFGAQVAVAQSTPPGFTSWARYDFERRVTGTIAPDDGSGVPVTVHLIDPPLPKQ